MSFLLLDTPLSAEECLVIVSSSLSGEENREEEVLSCSSVVSETNLYFQIEEPILVVVAVVESLNGFIVEHGFTIKALVYIGEVAETVEECQVTVRSVVTCLASMEVERSLTIVSSTSGLDYFYEEQEVTVVSEITEEDLPTAEGLVEITWITESDEYEEDRLSVSIATVEEIDVGKWIDQPIFVIVGGVQCEDYPVEVAELHTITVVSNVTCEDVAEMYAEEAFTVVSSTFPVEIQLYLDECSYTIRAIVKSLLVEAQAPSVKGCNPQPGETAVVLNKHVCFYIVAGDLVGDGVDISTVSVEINGVTYALADPGFSYSGSADQYFVEVSHPDWNYEQAVSVAINASSLCGEVMPEVAYDFTAEWASSLTRKGFARVELFQVADYALDVLTIEEDWVRQGVERYTVELELWWGRYQKLPCIENLQMSVEAGSTNALGKEVFDNGWFSVKVGDGDYVPMTLGGVVDTGVMFTHTHKHIFLKLMVPEGAATTRYFIFMLVFEPKHLFLYKSLPYSKGIYQDAGNGIRLAPNKHLYRSYVFDAAMWNLLTLAGVTSSMSYKGEDKRW